MQKAKFVELVGPPGAGKSTLCEVALNKNPTWRRAEYAAWFQFMHQKSDSRFQTLLQHLPTALSYRIYRTRYRNTLYRTWLDTQTEMTELMTLVTSVINSLNISVIERLNLQDRFRTVLAIQLLSYKYAHTQNTVVIADELCLQHLVSLFYARPSEVDLSSQCDNYIKLMPKPDAIIYCTGPAQVLWQRTKERQKGLPRIWKHFTEEMFTSTIHNISKNLAKAHTHPSLVSIPMSEASISTDYERLFATLRQ